MKHVVVVRYHQYAEPNVHGDAVRGSTYASGRVTGDGLVYRIDDTEFLGGFLSRSKMPMRREP